MTVLEQAHLYVDQLRREANKTRINVSEAIQDMKVNIFNMNSLGLMAAIASQKAISCNVCYVS